MKSTDIRNLRDKFWKSKQHAYLSEVSLVADKDSTAMFNVAGMQQLIPYLMGKPHDLGKRVFNIQRCIRTNDIDEVGDASHLTFFEMMGNWSLGDYFKKEAVERSWELLTSKEYFGLDPKKLAVTVFEGDETAPRDEETAGYWKSAGVPTDRISYLPARHNRRSPGPVGPCGPDTEIFYRVGKQSEFPAEGSNVQNDEDNWLEIWNNVFMEFYRDESGTMTKLKQQNVDTGMGFERMCKVLQGKETIFETDLFWGMIQELEALTNTKYVGNERRYRIVADHLRTALRVADDGLFPSNEGRGYVMRMVIRRMWYNLNKIGNTKLPLESANTFFKKISDNLGYGNGGKVIIDEVKRFDETLDKGIKLFNDKMKEHTGKIPGKDLFFLYDTCGIPFEMIKELCGENNITYPEKEINDAVEEAREKSRQGTKEMFKKGTDRSKYLEGINKTEFVGYDSTESLESKLLKDEIIDGQRVLIFDKTPFYAESGGQTGDKGMVELNGEKLEIIDVKKYEGVFLHFIK